MPATILTANSSNITVDEEDPIEGLQSISFRRVRDQQDVVGIGTDERLDVAYGLSRVVGKMVVASSSPVLNDRMENGTGFTITVNLKKTLGTSGEISQTVALQDCFVRDLHLGMAANDVATTEYEFTARSITISS